MPVSLMGSYLALRLACAMEEVPDWVSPLRDSLIEQGDQADHLGLIARARSGMPHTMVPFVRSDIDLAYASLMFAECRSALIRSELSWVQTGYFQKTSLQGDSPALRYVDRIEPSTGSSAALLDPDQITEIMARLRGAEGIPGQFLTPESGDSPLMIEIAPPFRHILPRSFSYPAHRLFVARLFTPSGALALAPLGFRLQESVVTTDALPVERLMELQAAAAQGLWITLQHNRLRILGPLPDLLTPGSRSDCWIEPTREFGERLGGSVSATLQLPRAIAAAMMRRFSWLACPDPLHWRSLLELAR
jgi:hypothetical protein